MTYAPHISDVKKQEIEEIKRLFKDYKVAGIVNLEGLPTLMLQRIKFALGDSIFLKPTKKRLICKAIDEMKDQKNIDQIKEKLKGIPALLFTNEDPFLLYKKLEKSKASAAAKPGQRAPNDLGVEAGETPFTPGPMIGELGMLGMKTEVKNGKIHLRDDKILVKEGDEISEQVASLLAKLGIEPMKIGLNLMLTYENGEILDKSILAVDEEEYIGNIKAAYSESFALAMHLGILNSETVKPLINKAQRESLALADSTNIVTSETIGRILAKAETTASNLNTKVPKEEKAPEPVEQPKTEEKTLESEEAPKTEQPVEETPVKVQEKATEEQPKDVKTEMEDVANIANKILGNGIKGDSDVKKELNNEQDVNKLINTLKDQKSNGEI